MSIRQKLWIGAVAVFKREPWWAEFWSGTTAIMWGILSIFSTYNRQTWPASIMMEDFGGEMLWNATALIMGVVQIGFLIADHRWLRWTGALVMCWFWAVLTLAVVRIVPGSPTIAVYIGWCGINCFSILRLLRHHG